MICKQCDKGQMVQAKVYRLSGCLANIGVILLLLVVVDLGVASCIAIVGTKVTSDTAQQADDRHYYTALRELSTALGETSAATIEFRERRTISEATMQTLAEADARRARSVLQTYVSSIAGTALGTGIFALLGTGAVATMFIASIPALIVGLILRQRKKVWKCEACGHFIDRA